MTELASQNVEVPMNDLRVQYEQIKPQIDAALAGVVENCSFILGPQVEGFEEAFADYNDVKHCIGVSNGTDALKLALRAANIGEGDEVITTSFTFGATVEAICDVGARPVFADIHEAYFTLDVDQVKNRITNKTRAIIPVHIYGQVADMEPLLALAAEHDLKIIEDAAQAQGARYKEYLAGSLGHMGCFSFYPGKNLGAYGDAGGLITDDDGLAAELRLLRNHGQDPQRKFNYRGIGYNHRMDGFQGAVLQVKLPYLDTWNKRRRRVADRYNEGLKDVDALILPAEAEYAYHVYHLYVVRVSGREEFGAELKREGISTAVQYPYALHLTDAYAHLGYKEGALPVTEKACQEIISLPLYPDLLDQQVDYVVEKVRRYFR